MKQDRGRHVICLNSTLILINILMIFPVVGGSPSRFSLFHGSAYSSSPSRPRNKNWCAFVVQKNVSCAVLDEIVSSMPCSSNQPQCSQQIRHHPPTRPMYKIGFKQVTELEWRCCPGFYGHDCKDQRESKQNLEHSQGASTASSQQQGILGPGVSETHLWTQNRQNERQLSQQETESQRVQSLEEEVERLSQTVLELQALTSANANLKLDLQEDVTKFVLNMLTNLQQPQDIKAGEVETIIIPTNLHSASINDKIQNQISTNTNNIQDLQKKIHDIDRKLFRFSESSIIPPTATISECQCQQYISDKISALREELLRGIEIKIADMKNSCDYKLLSIKEQCEEQETAYMSLAELIDSKEVELRKEIQDLRLEVHIGEDQEFGNHKVQRLKDDLQDIKDTIRVQNSSLMHIMEHGHSMEARVNLVEKNIVENSLNIEEKLNLERLHDVEKLKMALKEKIRDVEFDYNSSQRLSGHEQRLNILEKHTKDLQDELGSYAHLIKRGFNASREIEILNQRMDSLAVSSERDRQQVTRVIGTVQGLDGRVTGIEGVCGKFDPMSDSLKRIKDGLNKHVNGLWTCVRQLNSTVLTHTRQINTFKASVFKGKTALKTSMEGSQALVSMSESGSSTKASSHTPSVTGYAGAPGYPRIPVAPALSPDSGVFTAPLAGRYLLTAVLKAEPGEQIEAFLSVGNRSIQKLNTAASVECSCGGSTLSLSLLLHLKHGERSGLVLTAGKLAISASSENLSTFSGFLLYPSLSQR
ncbi:hypothetical protein DNTS_012408 [Danionella cerebrum]|uniref:EMI domain-containing protein n=1 Tax=Danionella cerebrum TaxID=2873325 RepID=A0A553N0R5_9TELE|nr:hypothetical protein DNTS_012408 [Danionella translucida]